MNALRVEDTIISQYGASPITRQLIRDIDSWINQQVNFTKFVNFVWNVDTARGFGLDIWGRIVGVVRNIRIPTPSGFFGFQDGFNDYSGFNQDRFFQRGESLPTSNTYTLTDTAFRAYILAKAISNISPASSMAINRLLNNLFAGRGRCYVEDLGGMQINYVFEFALLPYEDAILRTGVLLRPAGVGITITVPP